MDNGKNISATFYLDRQNHGSGIKENACASLKLSSGRCRTIDGQSKRNEKNLNNKFNNFKNEQLTD